MEKIVTWAVDNKEWLFSGLGVFVLSMLVMYFAKAKKNASSQVIRSGDQSTNVQVGGDIHVNNEPGTNAKRS